MNCTELGPISSPSAVKTSPRAEGGVLIPSRGGPKGLCPVPSLPHYSRWAWRGQTWMTNVLLSWLSPVSGVWGREVTVLTPCPH